jgi:hypothetical protein
MSFINHIGIVAIVAIVAKKECISVMKHWLSAFSLRPGLFVLTACH